MSVDGGRKHFQAIYVGREEAEAKLMFRIYMYLSRINYNVCHHQRPAPIKYLNNKVLSSLAYFFAGHSCSPCFNNDPHQQGSSFSERVVVL